jgi:hypothetical protein
MKVLTFSTKFPKGHPKAGQPTYFVEKVMACLADRIPNWAMYDSFVQYDWYAYYNCTMPKGHTIRVGSRWKAGDMASLRVWSGAPYRSKQIEFAQVEVKRVWAFEINDGNFSIDTIQIGSFIPDCGLQQLANNDGLHVDDFWTWFSIHPKKKENTFRGQIICWSDKIDYTSITTGKPDLQTTKAIA